MSGALRTAASMLGGRRALYWIGNGIWLTFAMSVAAVYPCAVGGECSAATGLLHRACYALSFFVVGALVRRGRFGDRYSLARTTVLCTAFALAGFAAYVATGFDWLSHLTAALLGFGNACGFCQWLRVLAPHGLCAAKHLLIGGSVVHIALMFALNSWVPEAARPWCVFGLCAPVGIALLVLNVRLNSASPVEQARCENVDRMRCSQAVRSVRLPIVCAVALTLITPIASSVFGSTGGLMGSAVSTLAQLMSLAILSVVWFALHRNLTLPQLYCVSLPLFASAILCVSFASPEWGWVVLAIGESCFFFVSVLMVVTCLTAAQRFEVSSLAVYGVFAGCMYLTDAIRLAIEGMVASGLDIEPYVAALLLLYVLMIPAFCIVAPLMTHKAAPGRLPAKPDGPMLDPEVRDLAGRFGASAAVSGFSGAGQGDLDMPTCVVPAVLTVAAQDACGRIAEARGLSKRQTEVMRYLIIGRDVDHIAEALNLSPNTVRSYRKSLYAALGVHGRQELLDLVEHEANKNPGRS